MIVTKDSMLDDLTIYSLCNTLMRHGVLAFWEETLEFITVVLSSKL